MSEPPRRSSPLWPRASSKIVGVIGDPVEHSLSPLLHNAAFDALGLDWVSVGFKVPKGHARDALTAVRALGIVGISVTTPHKEDTAGWVDELSPLASRLGAVNCVVRRDDTLFGDNTDGEGFVEALRRGCDFDPAGRRCAVLGAGGAARAVILALSGAGAAEVAVVNRNEERAKRAAELAGSVGKVAVATEISAADLVVQATSVGLSGATATSDVAQSEALGPEHATPVDPRFIRRGQLVVDLVYKPDVTAFMEAARKRGARVFGGLGMLVHQAALAIERWTGHEAPVEAMWRVARSGYR